jgi:hypothetical protein
MQQLSRKTSKASKLNVVGTAESGAVFDASGSFRYELWRSWDQTKSEIVFIMLNPSTADDTVNDPTIKRCISFAQTWKYGSLRVVNLFAYRATDHRLLLKTRDPVGPDNDRFIETALRTDGSDLPGSPLHGSPLPGSHKTVVLAWGNRGALLERGDQVIALAAKHAKRRLRCFGYTKEGQPCHPLYLPGNSKLVKL